MTQKTLKRCRLVGCRLALLCIVALFMGGCVLTKIVTVPMRLVGAVVSIVPVAGNSAHEVIDEAAEAVDELPL